MENSSQRKKIERIDALTSLRFFAVALIVLHHSVGHFDITRESLGPFAFGHAVSFFFVLSGFIIAYVYGDLRGRAECQRFFIARFARLWPAHVFTGLFFSVFILLPNGWVFSYKHNLLITFSNFFMVHSWIPIWDYFFSFNPQSWCVSTEIFFYLIFPFAIIKWQKTWAIKIVISLVILFLMIKLTSVLKLPVAGQLNSKACIAGMVYINPLSRTFEFLVGMTTCLFWKKTVIRRIGFYSGTLIEITVLSLCVLSLYYTQSLIQQMPNMIGPIWRIWLYHTLSVPLIVLLIFFMALQKGLISKIINLRFFVVLGEMSYSIFLTHYIIIYLYSMHIESKLPAQRLEDYVVYWIVLLLSSYLLWKCIEEPSRRLILRFFDFAMVRKKQSS